MFSASHGCQAIASAHDGGATYTPLTERAVEFLLGIHCERGLAISDRFAHGDNPSAEVLEYSHPKRVP